MPSDMDRLAAIDTLTRLVTQYGAARVQTWLRNVIALQQACVPDGHWRGEEDVPLVSVAEKIGSQQVKGN